jgi:hypothetical protein
VPSLIIIFFNKIFYKSVKLTLFTEPTKVNCKVLDFS